MGLRKFSAPSFKLLTNFESQFTISKATIIIAFFTLLSRVIGLVRTRLFTSEFGAGATLDTYFAAFRIPDFITTTFVIGTLSVAFLPIFAQLLVKDPKEAHTLARTVVWYTVLGMTGLCIIAFLFAPFILPVIVPGFTSEQLTSTIGLMRLILVSQIIFSISTLLSSVLNAYKRFLFAALAPIVYNVGIIFGLKVLFPNFGLSGLGYGVIVGAALHLLVQLPASRAAGFKLLGSVNWHSPYLRKVINLYIPRLFFIDLAQVSLLVASIFGSMLAAGSITEFTLAYDIQAVATGIFALSIATAVFPVLAEQFARHDAENFWLTLARSIGSILFFLVPGTILLLVLRAYVVRILFGAGAFDWEDTRRTFEVLGILSLALVSQGLVPVLSRALFARHNTKVPMLVGFVSMAVNLFCAYLLTPSYGVSGIAYAFTIASVVNCIILFIVLRRSMARDFVNHPQHATQFDLLILDHALKVVGCALLAGFIAYVALRLVAPFVDTRTGLGILVQAGVSGGLGGVVFMYAAYLSGLPNAQRAAAFVNRLRTTLLKFVR